MTSALQSAPVLPAANELGAVGWWRAGAQPPALDAAAMATLIAQVREPLHVVRQAPRAALALARGGEIGAGAVAKQAGLYELMATLPALYPEWLGDRSFCEVHGVRFPYVAGEMANGIATTRMVIALARAEMLGFFGAAGLRFDKVEQAVDEMAHALGEHASWGVNLIHSPNEAALEARVADLLIRRGVRRICASAFLGLTPSVVRCAASGLRLDARGQILRRIHVFAKVSRPEIAERFMAPAPADMLHALVQQGLLTPSEAELAARVPVAEDITVEADSGGHTDNRPMVALLPAILALRDVMVQRHRYTRPIRVGAAGGIGTPQSVAAAFALGAAYVVTGSVNQAAVESGLSDDGKQLLAQADLSDVIMAPAADMFEQGVRVQVLRRGTMFGTRGARLYELYREYPSLESIPAEARTQLERNVLHATLDEIWADTRHYWQQRDPHEIALAEKDPKHRMALVFRWYLGNASRWAIVGETARRTDYQIWCGPAMGAFNRWVAGSFLADPKHRSVVQIARNLLEGAAVITRAQQLRSYGVSIPTGGFHYKPRPLS
jgi:PfaD family protein